MNTITATVTSTEWTHDYLTSTWETEQADDADMDHRLAVLAGDQQVAWLINNVNRIMRGWSYVPKTGTFTGPGTAVGNIVDSIYALMMMSSGHVIESLEDLRAELAKA